MNRVVEITIALVLLGFVALMYFESFNPIYRGFGQPEFPPMRFPRWILIAIGALAVLHLLRSLLGLGKSEALFSQTIWLRTMLAALATLAGALLIKPIGFTFASMLTFCSVGWILGYTRIVLLVFYGIVFSLATWALFTFLIKLGLPTSPWLHRI